MDEFLDHQVKFFNMYLDLAEQGVDWLAETSKACRARGVSPWVSCRMNDMHGAANPTGSHFNCALFKQARFRLSGRPLDLQDTPHISWMGLNYGNTGKCGSSCSRTSGNGWRITISTGWNSIGCANRCAASRWPGRSKSP